jgi:ubiquinone/menaquinone biosynthesis C-methylase UbiE
MVLIPVYNDPHHIDEWSETYEHSFMQWLIFDRLHRGVLRRIPQDFTPVGILDIGVGTGRLLRKLYNHWPAANLVGIDTSEVMVVRARKKRSPVQPSCRLLPSKFTWKIAPSIWLPAPCHLTIGLIKF